MLLVMRCFLKKFFFSVKTNVHILFSFPWEAEANACEHFLKVICQHACVCECMCVYDN